jgi:hypothetical protein
MIDRVILDTGPLVAFINGRDKYLPYPRRIGDEITFAQNLIEEGVLDLLTL